MNPEDYSTFLTLIELIEDGKLDRLSRLCLIIGVMAGLNSDAPEVYEQLTKIPEVVNYEAHDAILDLLEAVETFED